VSTSQTINKTKQIKQRYPTKRMNDEDFDLLFGALEQSEEDGDDQLSNSCSSTGEIRNITHLSRQ